MKKKFSILVIFVVLSFFKITFATIPQVPLDTTEYYIKVLTENKQDKTISDSTLRIINSYIERLESSKKKDRINDLLKIFISGLIGFLLGRLNSYLIGEKANKEKLYLIASQLEIKISKFEEQFKNIRKYMPSDEVEYSDIRYSGLKTLFERIELFIKNPEDSSIEFTSLDIDLLLKYFNSESFLVINQSYIEMKNICNKKFSNYIPLIDKQNLIHAIMDNLKKIKADNIV